MRTPLQRIRRGAVFLGLVFVGSVIGHHWISGRPWLEAVYWFVITASSVGFTEVSSISPAMQIYSIVVILLGMSAAIYTFGGFIQLMTAGEIEQILGVRRMTHDIERLKQHVIICGYGRIGQILAAELAHLRKTFVVIDSASQPSTLAREHGYLVLTGDATAEEVLQLAGVERAAALVSGLPSDADNVFITLTSRNLNPQLQIIARGEQPSSEKKLRQAGADRVVMTAAMGAHRMARLITRPHTATLIEQFTDRKLLDVELDELLLAENSPLIGKTVGSVEAPRKHQLLIVALHPPHGPRIFNPDEDHRFAAGELLIVMGRTPDIEAFRNAYRI